MTVRVESVKPKTRVIVAASQTELIEVSSAGPQGIQGPVGPAGPQGPEGPQGLSGADYEAPELRSATAGVYTYLGRAALKTDETDNTWTIARFAVDAGAVATEHATGAWTNREALSYE